MISYNTVPHGLGPAVRSIRPCHSNVVSPRDVTICASSGEPSPLDELPASLAKRFRNARNQKRSRSSKGQGPTGPSTSQSAPPVPTAAGATPGLTLADVWQDSDTDGSAPSAAAAADQSVFTELAKVQAQTLVDSVGGAGKGSPGRSRGRNSYLDSINVADAPSGNPVPHPSARPAPSRRTEDEEIRASRQQRMEEQGLDGSADTGWRTGDESTNTSGEVTGAKDFSELLRPDSSDSDADASLSAEQFTMQKEARERERGAGIISSDATYKPSVGTWGVYQRPRDISKTYGGGRTLTPADSATSEEEQAKLDAQLQKQLAAFRRSAGKVLLRKGNLRGALVIFDEAASMLNLKTTAGGQALLQKAITLDSMGNSEEALNIYRQLRTHRCLEVAKTAKRMSYGFRAGEFLKAEQFSYAAKKEEYEPFFNSLRGKWGWDTVYVASEEDKAAEKKGNLVLAAVLALMASAPLGFFYYVTFQC